MEAKLKKSNKISEAVHYQKLFCTDVIDDWITKIQTFWINRKAEFNWLKNVQKSLSKSNPRSSHRSFSSKFCKINRKNKLYRSLFFNKVAGLRPATLLKKRLWHVCFTRKFSKIFKNTFFTEYLRAAASNMWKLQIQLKSNKLWFNSCLTD